MINGEDIYCDVVITPYRKWDKLKLREVFRYKDLISCLLKGVSLHSISRRY